MRLEGTSAGEVASVLRLDRAEADDRIDRIVETLKPRIDPPVLSATGDQRGARRWL
jgi:hypothetical protein